VVIVVDSNNHRLVLWRLGDGTVWKELGSYGKEPGQFYQPSCVAVTSTGALVVADRQRVQVLTVDGAVLCVLDPTAVAGGRRGKYLCGVTICGDTKEIIIADEENHYDLCDLASVTVCAGTDEILGTIFNQNRVVALTWSPSFSVRLCSYICELPFFLSRFTSSCVG
jgi:hypothetical protein